MAEATFRIVSIERAEQAAGIRPMVVDAPQIPARAGYDARVEVVAPDGRLAGTLYLDRIDGEAQWHVWAEFGPTSSMPRFMNGLFSRCTLPKVAGPELAAVLDEAAAEVQA